MLQPAKHYLLFLFISLLSIKSSFAVILDANSATENRNIALLTVNPPTIISIVRPVFSLAVGASVSQLGQSQSFTPLDLCQYSYEPQGSKTNTVWGGFVGSEVRRSLLWEAVVGLSYYQLANLSTTGTLIQGADSESNSVYGYSYQTQSQQLLAEGKLYWIVKENVRPFLMVGIGAAFNKTTHYQTNVPPFFEFTPMFFDRSQTSFTYTVGSGVDVNLTNSFRIGIGYRFTDLGAAATGSAQIDTIPISNSLQQPHIYANQILAQLTFTPWTRD